MKSQIKACLLWLQLILASSTLWAQNNTNCANAIALTNNLPYSVNTSAAPLGSGMSDSCGASVYHGVWFTITPTNNERVIISTAGSGFGTALSVYTNVCGALSNAVDAYGSVQCSGTYSYGAASVSFSSVSNVTYHVLVGGYYTTSYGNLTVTATFTNPPPNDTCAGAIPLTNGVPFTQDTTLATELGDLTSSCGYNAHGVWFTITPTNNERVIISTAGSGFGTALSVYTNVCGALSNAVDAYGSVQCSGTYSYGAASVSFSSVSNVTYHVLVGGYYTTSYGNLTVTATFTNPPPNDTCAGAIPLTNGVPFTQDTTLATELGDLTSSCGYNAHGVWFTITPTNNERVIISTAGSGFGTALSVYTNVCGALSNAVDAYGSVQCSGTYSYGAASVSFSSVSNVTYHVLVGGYYTTSYGNLTVTATFTNPPPNDTCAGAIPLTNGVPFTQDTTLATELGDLTSSCGYNAHGVWFTITPTNNERVIISTAGSGFGTALSVYTNVCGALSNAVDAYGSVQCSGTYSYGAASVSFSSVSNVTYHVLVGGYYTTSYGNLTVTATFTNPPPNDTCAGAIPLTNGVPYYESTVFASEVGDPIRDCNNNFIGHGVWFTLSAFAGQQVTISTCGSTYNGNTDLMVYTNDCGSLGSPFLCSSGGNTFNCSSSLAGLSFVSPNNQTYYILVSGVGSASGTLQITANQPAPTNDKCAFAIPLTNGVTYFVTNIYATSTDDPVPTCVPNFGRGVWYSYTPSITGLVGITTSGSSFPTALAVYSGTCGSTNLIACSQSSGAYGNLGRADVNFYGTNGATYLILAGGVNGAAGTLQIQIPVVDLVSTGLTASNASGGLLTAGRNFNASWTVQNQGTNSISGTWTDSLSLSNALTNVVVATFNSPPAALAGGSYTNSRLNIPLPPIPVGNYSLIAQADTGNAVAEANKANNVQVLSVTITNLLPTITLFRPTNTVQMTSCAPVSVLLSAGVVPGSYTVTNVQYFDGATPIGVGTNPAQSYRTFSAPLDHSTHAFSARVSDFFGYSSVSTNISSLTINWPAQANVVRADVFSNYCYVCMAATNAINYVLESKTNLPSPVWQPLATNPAANSVVVFTNQQTVPVRFYRLSH